MVRRILGACNPRLASGLRGIIATVDQVVKVGSLIEKDWSNSKDYWSRLQQTSPPEHSPKKPSRKPEHSQGRGHGRDVASVLGVPTLLVVPIGIRGLQGDTVLDSGCMYSLMSRTLWNSIRKAGENIGASGIPKCIMANGKASTAIGRIVLLLTLHDAPITVGIHVLGDDQLYMPLLLGLDFMCAGQIILKPHT